MEERRKKKKSKKFQKGLIIYTGILAVLAIFTWVLLFCFIKDYEEGQPKHVMENIVSNFTEESIGTLLGSDIATNEFESKDQVVEYLVECGKTGDVTYRKKPGDYTEATPVYELIVNKKAIAKVSLATTKKNAFKFNIWTVGSVNISDYISGDSASVYQISVPTGSKVTINGIEVKDSYITESDKQFSPCLNLEEFLKTVPTMTVYEVKGLLFDPEVEVTLDGTKLEKVEKEEAASSKSTIEIAYAFPADTAWLEENEDDVISIGKNYGLYIINKMDLATLKKTMVGAAADLVSDIPAIWAYKSGGKETFNDVTVKDCVKYSDDCYSVNITYNLNVTWPNNPDVADKNYDTDLTFCYVKVGSDWKLANFVIN